MLDCVITHCRATQLSDGFLLFVQLFPGTNTGPKSPAGFATLKTLQLSADVRMAGVAVFGRPSGKESLILKVKVTALLCPESKRLHVRLLYASVYIGYWSSVQAWSQHGAVSVLQ